LTQKTLDRPSGTLLHDLTEIAKRKLWGSERVKAKQELKNVKAGVYRRKVYGDRQHTEATERGELTEVQTVPIFKKARAEVKKL